MPGANFRGMCWTDDPLFKRNITRSRREWNEKKGAFLDPVVECVFLLCFCDDFIFTWCLTRKNDSLHLCQYEYSFWCCRRSKVNIPRILKIDRKIKWSSQFSDRRVDPPSAEVALYVKIIYGTHLFCKILYLLRQGVFQFVMNRADITLKFVDGLCLLLMLHKYKKILNVLWLKSVGCLFCYLEGQKVTHKYAPSLWSWVKSSPVWAPQQYASSTHGPLSVTWRISCKKWVLCH